MGSPRKPPPLPPPPPPSRENQTSLPIVGRQRAQPVLATPCRPRAPSRPSPVRLNQLPIPVARPPCSGLIGWAWPSPLPTCSSSAAPSCPFPQSTASGKPVRPGNRALLPLSSLDVPTREHWLTGISRERKPRPLVRSQPPAQRLPVAAAPGTRGRRGEGVAPRARQRPARRPAAPCRPGH